MPVSGRPTNAALLKITHVAPCPDTKLFQNTREAAGARSADPACAELLLHSNHRIVTPAANSSAPSEMLATIHFRWLWPCLRPCHSVSTGGLRCALRPKA